MLANSNTESFHEHYMDITTTSFPYLACGNSGRSNQTLSIRAFVLHRLGVSVHPFTKSQRTW